MDKNNFNVPSGLATTACLSATLSIILSLISLTASILGVIYRFKCSLGDLANRNGSEFFLVSILQTYILNSDCSSANNINNITKADSVFILEIIIMIFAAINFVTSVTLIAAAKLEEASKNLDIVAYIHVGASFACLVVDLTLGVHFGMDYTTLTNTLAINPPDLINYHIDAVRIGAFLLMTLSLKGYIGHAINLILLVLLIVQVVNYQKESKHNEHPIHKLGVLNAFDPPRRFEDSRISQRNDVFPAFSRGLSANHAHDESPHNHNQTRDHHFSSLENSNTPKRLEDPWQMNRNDNMFSGYPKRSQGGPHINPAYEEEPSRPSPRENPIPDYNSRNAKRTDSWLHNQMASGPGLGSRPFSYLEEAKRPIPVKTPSMPVNEPQWRRDAWPPAPPVPDPDYSPTPRRLKSALKSNYP